jgi:prepilin-type processing-associated H-X9-DG protein
MLAIVVPAVQKVRGAVSRIQCANNLKQLAIACLNYESRHQTLPYGRKYDIWDSYTWTQLTLPYIDQDAVYRCYWTLPQTGYKAGQMPGPNSPIGDDASLKQGREANIQVWYCPADSAPCENEIDTNQFGFLRGNYRGCVGNGDLYGNRTNMTDGGWGPGIFSVRARQSFDPGAAIRTVGVRFSEIVDGTSNTILLSEGIVPTVASWGGALGEIIYGNMGGALFSTTLPPNSAAPDELIGPCPQDRGDLVYREPCRSIGVYAWWTPSASGAHAAARSTHSGGVNAALADGSVRFFTNATDHAVWRAMGTRDRMEPRLSP